MIQSDRRWNLLAALAQSVLLFLVLCPIFAMPRLLDDTYATALEGTSLPPMTQWIRELAPEDMAGILCLATSAALTNLCIGILLITTAATALIATQRTIFLTSTTWGIVLFSVILLLVALTLPFVTIISRLSTLEDAQAEAARSRTWIFWTSIYCVALVGTTIAVYRTRRKARAGGGPTTPSARMNDTEVP